MLAITIADVARLAANVDPAYESYDIDITNPSANIVVKLADFGNWVDKNEPARLRVPPTCPYRAPETFLTKLVDTCTDMWSMGCVLFEMVVGKLLFSCHLHRTVKHPLVHFIMMNSMVGPVPRAPYEGNLRPHVINMFGEDGNIRMPPGTMAGSAFVAIALLNNLNFDDAKDFSELMHKFLKYDMKERVTAEVALTDKFLLPNGGRTPSGQEMVRQNRSQQSSNYPSSGWNLALGRPISEEEALSSYAGERQNPEDGPSHSGQDF
uniref:Protein kinase domain-containing protein n=1 Tax=Caenorhabditis tropicalis TaxID=1561998 RepID=A0A1I7U255_9PELO